MNEPITTIYIRNLAKQLVHPPVENDLLPLAVNVRRIFNHVDARLDSLPAASMTGVLFHFLQGIQQGSSKGHVYGAKAGPSLLSYSNDPFE
jgi:hypothetical protein